MILNPEKIDDLDKNHIPIEVCLVRLRYREDEDKLLNSGFDPKDLKKLYHSPIWMLRFSIYQPMVHDTVHKIKRERLTIYGSKEELQTIIKEKFIPLYQRATDRLKAIVDGEAKYLDSWDEPAEQIDE
jgi:hypothetical protein